MNEALQRFVGSNTLKLSPQFLPLIIQMPEPVFTPADTMQWTEVIGMGLS